MKFVSNIFSSFSMIYSWLQVTVWQLGVLVFFSTTCFVEIFHLRRMIKSSPVILSGMTMLNSHRKPRISSWDVWIETSAPDSVLTRSSIIHGFLHQLLPNHQQHWNSSKVEVCERFIFKWFAQSHVIFINLIILYY